MAVAIHRTLRCRFWVTLQVPQPDTKVLAVLRGEIGSVNISEITTGGTTISDTSMMHAETPAPSGVYGIVLDSPAGVTSSIR
jgi:hypothetical protein